MSGNPMYNVYILGEEQGMCSHQKEEKLVGHARGLKEVAVVCCLGDLDLKKLCSMLPLRLVSSLFFLLLARKVDPDITEKVGHQVVRSCDKH